jgi:hypothetical protein
MQVLLSLVQRPPAYLALHLGTDLLVLSQLVPFHNDIT